MVQPGSYCDMDIYGHLSFLGKGNVNLDFFIGHEVIGKATRSMKWPTQYGIVEDCHLMERSMEQVFFKYVKQNLKVIAFC